MDEQVLVVESGESGFRNRGFESNIMFFPREGSQNARGRDAIADDDHASAIAVRAFADTKRGLHLAIAGTIPKEREEGYYRYCKLPKDTTWNFLS